MSCPSRRPVERFVEITMDDLSSGSRLQVEDGVPPVPKNQENKHLKSNQFQVQNKNSCTNDSHIHVNLFLNN